MIQIVLDEMTDQLFRENKQLIAMTGDYVLVKWISDSSYVSWIWKHNEEGFYFECGQYIPTKGNTEADAIAAFAERINNVV